MKAWDFHVEERTEEVDAVVFDGEEWCVGCMPQHKNADGYSCDGGAGPCDECTPILAIEERDRHPVCGHCNFEHTDYGTCDRVGCCQSEPDEEDEEDVN